MRNESEGELTPGLIPVDEPWPSVPEEGVALCLSGVDIGRCSSTSAGSFA